MRALFGRGAKSPKVSSVAPEFDGKYAFVNPAATIEMVAARAGVSRSTVSQVLDSSPEVPSDVVDSVTAAIAELGYVPSHHGTATAGKRSYSITLVIPETTSKFFADPYFAAVIQGAAAFLADTDYVLNLLVGSPAESEKTLRYLQSGNVDGVLVISHHSDDSSYLLLGKSVPVVFAGRPTGLESDDSYYVNVDNVGAAATATRHLIERGRKRIATIAGPQNMVVGVDRLEGWNAAITAAGLTPGPVEVSEFTQVGGVYAMRRLLKHEEKFDGLFAASSQIAAGALSVLREAGLAVPRDVGITTVDNDQFSINADPPLTTMEQPTTLHGARIAEMLLDIIEGRAVERHATISTTLVVRESA